MKRIVSSSFAIGILLRFRIFSTTLPKQAESMNIKSSDQVYMNAIITEGVSYNGLSRQSPPAADEIYHFADKILVFSEQKKPVAGNFVFIHVQGRMISYQNEERTHREIFNTFRIKP